MTTDIVTRLREYASFPPSRRGTNLAFAAMDAADEIERLRAIESYFRDLVTMVNERCFTFDADGEEYNNYDMLSLLDDFMTYGDSNQEAERRRVWQEARRD